MKALIAAVVIVVVVAAVVLLGRRKAQAAELGPGQAYGGGVSPGAAWAVNTSAISNATTAFTNPTSRPASTGFSDPFRSASVQSLFQKSLQYCQQNPTASGCNGN